MKLGLAGVNVGPGADPSALRDVAARAEAAGFESLWVAEHVVLPVPRPPGSALPSGTPILDPLVALGYLASVTGRVRLGTGVVVLPQHRPVSVAKQIASVDVLSGGRVLLGVAAGYVAEEFAALGVDFSSRGALLDDHLGVLDQLWYHEVPSFDGPFSLIHGVDAHPRPRQLRIPLLVGGMSRTALRRALRVGDGWFGHHVTSTSLRDALREIDSLTPTVARPPGLGPLDITVMPGERLTEDLCRSFADLGVDRVVVWAPATTERTYALIESAPRLWPWEPPPPASPMVATAPAEA